MSSDFSESSIDLTKRLTNHGIEYWYMSLTTAMSATQKKSSAAWKATGRYSSRVLSIISSVLAASSALTWISFDVTFDCASVLISCSSSRMLPRRLGEQLEDGRLDVLELRGHARVRDDELVLLRLQVGPLLGDGDAEELVLEALLRDGEVEQRHLDGRLGRVVRVGQLGRHVVLEVVVVRDGVVADLHDDVAALLERLLEQDGLERGVEVLEHVLHDDGLAEAHRVLERAQELLVGRLARLHARLGLHVLDPLVGLPLRVDAERPAEGRREDDAVLRREAVGGQAVDLPRAQLHRVGHHLDERRALGVRHVERDELRAPVLGERVAVLRDEGAEVGDVARREADVADQVALLDREALDGLLPADLLAAEAAEQPPRAVLLDGRVGDLGGELLLLRDRLVELVLEHRDLVGHLLELRAQLRQVGVELVEVLHRRRERLPLRLDLLGDEVVLVHRVHPLAHGRARLGGRLDLLGREVLVLDVRLQRGDHLLGDVVLVEVEHRVEQLLAVGEHLLARVPVVGPPSWRRPRGP